jgi:putative transposase
MARKPRVEYPGAFYHVICRGNHRQVIFRADPDRKYYLQRLENYRQRYGFTLYAYVLMSNHVHLLIETGEVPLSKIMQGLQFTYTRYFNTSTPSALGRTNLCLSDLSNSRPRIWCFRS